MASLKGATELWSAVTVSNTDASTWAYVGTGTAVAVYISANAATVFKVQASSGAVAVGAGLNEIDSDDPDGGLVWFDYVGATGISVAQNGNTCFDLSPFGPPYLRLVLVSGGDATVTALVSSAGPN